MATTKQMNFRILEDLEARLRRTAERLSEETPGTVTVADLLREGAELVLAKYAKPQKKLRRRA